MSNPLSENVLTEWSEIRTVPPAIQALTLVQAKDHLRLPRDSDYFDSALTLDIQSAIERVEHDTDRSLIEQTYQMWGHLFPQPSGFIPITRVPTTFVESVKYIDTDDAPQTLDPELWYYDEARRLIFPAANQVWPETNFTSKSVVIEYKAGSIAANEIPADLLSAALLVISELFYGIDVRENYENLIARYKRSRYP